MVQVVNEQRNTSELVEKYIGTAFDTVRYVANNLAKIAGLVDQSNKWQGEFAEAPVLRLDGTPLQGGDAYYNLKTKRTYVYVITGTACPLGMWTDALALRSGVEVITIAAGDIVGNDTVINLTSDYTPNTGNIVVFVGGSYQNSLFNDTDGSYEETSSNSITFPDVQLQTGEQVTVLFGLPLTTGNAVISLKQISNLQGFTGVDGDKVHITGFYEGSGYGGGEFYWDSECDKGFHNGGTVIDPLISEVPGTSNWYSPVVGEETGCWIRIKSTETDAAWYGVVYDGTTDVTAAFEAIDANEDSACIKGNTDYNINQPITNLKTYSYGPINVSGSGSITNTDLLGA